MLAVMIILCAVSFTASVYLIARFAIKKREKQEIVEETKDF